MAVEADTPDSGVAFHNLDAAATAARLGVDPHSGLDSGEAARRLARHGPNAIAEKPARGPLRMLAGQFTDFMILVLIAAAVDVRDRR